MNTSPLNHGQSNGHATTRKTDETFRLLDISDSDDLSDDDDSKAIVPDLNLTVPTGAGQAGVLAGRLRRKIRLKRKQRDHRLSNGTNSLNQVSTSETGGSDSEYCEPSKLLRGCLPTNVVRCFCRPPRSHRSVSLAFAFVLCLFAVALASLAYYTVVLQGQITTLSIHLDPVIEERKSIADNHQLFTNQIGQISSNQSALKDNLTNLHGQVEMLASQVQQLNSSVTAVLKSLEAAPQLKSLPSEVLEVQKDVAQFGSRLADIESQLGKTDAELKAINKKQSETPQISRVTPPQQIKSREAETAIEERLANATARLDNKIDGIDTKLKSFGAEITEKVQKQEVRAKKSWQIIGDLQDNIHNVSAKASSNDVLCRANQREISNLQTKVSNLSTSSSSSSSKEQGV